MTKILTVLGCMALLGAGTYYVATSNTPVTFKTTQVSNSGHAAGGSCCQEATTPSCCAGEHSEHVVTSTDENGNCCAATQVASKSCACSGHAEVATTAEATKPACCQNATAATSAATCSGSCAEDSANCCQLKNQTMATSAAAQATCSAAGCQKECTHATGAEADGECQGVCPISGHTATGSGECPAKSTSGGSDQ